MAGAGEFHKLFRTKNLELKQQNGRAWFGVSYREDRPFVVEGIRKLIARGDYPEKC
jgi:hypothetical protein